ncbi:MAG: hypothetical protein K1060chlam1_01012 [Candidatus Anoxychlamydiales bacterium]|nr:hypothetical protein [Candidatus Anoxychlamydiales bacterium]
MTGVSWLRIEDKHVHDPYSFAEKSLPKEQQVKFCVVGGRICCPIANTVLAVGTVATITDCCKTVFASDSFTQHFMKYNNCFNCKVALDQDRVLIEIPLSAKGSVFLITIEDKHFQDPDSFAKKSLPKEQQVKFCIVGGRIYCPIDRTGLTVGTVAMITDCCQSVFEASSFSRYVDEYNKGLFRTGIIFKNNL